MDKKSIDLIIIDECPPLMSARLLAAITLATSIPSKIAVLQRRDELTEFLGHPDQLTPLNKMNQEINKHLDFLAQQSMEAAEWERKKKLKNPAAAQKLNPYTARRIKRKFR